MPVTEFSQGKKTKCFQLALYGRMHEKGENT
jgi:hypothetical protein